MSKLLVAALSVLSATGPSVGTRTYSIEEQRITRDKVFEKKQQEIIEKFKSPKLIGTTPYKDMNDFEVTNDAVDLAIETKMTESEKNEVLSGIRNYWCSEKVGTHKVLYTKLWYAIYPPGNIFSGYRQHFYIWGRDYCNGKINRYPDGYSNSGPGVAIDDLWDMVV